MGAWEESIGGVAGDPGTAEEKSNDDEGLDEGSGAHAGSMIEARCDVGCDEGENVVIIK